MEDPIVVRMDAEIYVDQSLGFEEEDGVVVQTSLILSDGRDAAEVYLPLEELVGEQIELSRIAGDYAFLYSLTHEFVRLAEKMREVAERMEDDLAAIGDLFDMDRGDLE